MAGRGIGADAVVAQRQVEQHGAGHDRHARRSHLQADALLVEPAHHAAGGVEPEGAAPGQQYRMHLFDHIAGREQVGLARARGGTAHVDAADRAGAREHHGAAGGPARVGEVADLDACHIGDGRAHRAIMSRPRTP